MIERLRQLAPFNLIDGAWISHCCPTGPIDEVHALLWSILNEEMGMGHKNKNHCQVWYNCFAACQLVTDYNLNHLPCLHDSCTKSS